MERPVCVAGTITLARYFEDSLPRAADEAFRRAEVSKATSLVPTIAIGEPIYTGLKSRPKLRIPKAAILQLRGELEFTTYLRQADPAAGALQAFLKLNIPELHGRMIHTWHRITRLAR